MLKSYYELLADLPIELLEVPKEVMSSVHLAVIRTQQVSAEKHRQLFQDLRQAGIGVQLHYSPVHLQPYYRNLGFGEGQFLESEYYAKSAISLPIFPGLSDEQQAKICFIVKSLLAGVID